MKKLIEQIKKMVSKGSSIDVHSLNYLSKKEGCKIPEKTMERIKSKAHVHTYKTGSANNSIVETLALDRDKTIRILEEE